MRKKTINIGIIGFGNIGSSVARNLRRNSSIIAENVGAQLRVKSVADRSPAALRRAKSLGIAAKSVNEIINDPEIDIVVEAVGGENPAKKILLDSIAHGKDVVTSNKEVIAKSLKKLLKEAEVAGVSILFEGAVGGGTPIIGPLRDDLAGNDITDVYGIVNGTTNFILSLMTDRGVEFSDALFQAKQLGFAEADPGVDINGIDAAYKSVILAGVAFGADVKMGDVYIEGISRISQEDIKYAMEIGYAIKLLAVVRRIDSRLEVRVHPTLIPKDHQLASVSGNLNAIYAKGLPVGAVLVSAQGAGGDPTSSSVIGDIIASAKRRIRGDGPVFYRGLKKVKLRKIDDIKSRYYIRLLAPDKFGVLAGISKTFADNKVSIQAVMQKETRGNCATIVILIHEVAERNLMRAIAKIKKLSVVREICNVIRVASDI